MNFPTQKFKGYPLPIAQSPQQMSQDTGRFRTQLKDQFYTKPEVASWFLDAIRSVLQWSLSPKAIGCSPSALQRGSQDPSILWVEPSAGSGSFVKGNSVLALDIDPKADGILKQDFLTWVPPDGSKPLLFFGNPPFGRQGSLAKKFLARAASFSNTKAICFILPLSFQKPSMFRCIPLSFHLVWSAPVPKNAFLVNGEEYDVPCIAQIWERRSVDRPVSVQEECLGFEYVPQDSGVWQLAFRRVGGKAGTAYLREEGPFAAQSHHFLHFDEAFAGELPELQKRINAHTFPTNTTGPRSLSKNEITSVINEILQKIYD